MSAYGARTARRHRSIAPYLLIAPTVLVLAGVLGYPLVRLVELSLQKYDLPQLIAHKGQWVGLANYREILTDPQFYTVLLRTVIFTVGTVLATVVVGFLIAELVQRSNRGMALAINVVLVAVWATPWLVSVALWQWMVDYEFGVANYLLTKLHLGNFIGHNWFDNPVQGLSLIGLVVVWGALPFVAITLRAGLTQVPAELYEAAELDGAGYWIKLRHITFPLLRPVFVIVTSLSVIWDFQVFNQVWVMRGERPSSDYFLMSVYAFQASFRINRYGYGSAIAVVIVLILVICSLGYVRGLVRIGSSEQA